MSLSNTQIEELLNSLKPCPWCGGTPVLIAETEKEGFTHYLRCRICHSYNGFGRVYVPDAEKGPDSNDVLASIINAWNSRV